MHQKIVRRDLTRNGPGSVKMIPEEADDLWIAYNLIVAGDSVMAVTVRKVMREAASGGRDAERVKLKLEINVEIGAFHTLEIDVNRPFVLRKDIWDSLALDVIHQASDPNASADLAVVLMQEGLCHILLIGKSITLTRARIETSIPRKHGPAVAGYDKALTKFFENILQDQFHKHLMLEAERRQLRSVIENKSRIILVHTTSGDKHSLREVLDAPNVMNMIKDTKAAQEVRGLKDFFSMLSNDPERACYGPKHVEVAHERMAIQTLLITDELFRSSDVATRKKRTTSAADWYCCDSSFPTARPRRHRNVTQG
ncbi:hypothetical protein SASPL_146453 [Salvia splendens]|uniref:eRF1/Pelota-like N-terminal domain-containing protein n=1 Tax=Salvia splendens TaxID=180675 RepID=A0A8X8WCS2_SALSN|nr:hypothetical protein SASPL_146453 [Salvia splendens]